MSDHGELQPGSSRVPSAGRAESLCPARYRLRRIDGLPAVHQETEASAQGRAVHAWLARQHSSSKTCTATTIAQAGEPKVTALLEQHLAVCPLSEGEPAPHDIRIEPPVLALDGSTGILLVARPDLAVQADGTVRWRETKTAAVIGATAPDRLIVSDVTAALYLTLLASGTDGPPDALEWEVLTTAGAELTVLDPADADLVDAARMTISSAVADVIADDTFPARPGKICSTCPVARWCPSSAA